MLGSACQELPEVRYETRHLKIGTDFDQPVCRGTLDLLDRRAQEVREITARSDAPPIHLYWAPDLVDAWCDDESNGCFFPGTKVAVASRQSLGHEIVHAVLDSDSDAFFVEEGLAEYLSGVGARIRRTGDLEDLLRLSRRDYQSGRLSYRQATHFMAFVHQVGGDNAVSRLASALGQRRGRTGIRQVLEEILGESLDEIAVQWQASPERFFGASQERAPEVPPPGEESNVWRWTLDCDDPDTFGPLDENEPSMFRVGRLYVPVSGWVEVGVFGDAPASVTIFDPYAGDDTRRAVDWGAPDPSVDPDALHFQSPTQQWVWVEQGTRLLLVSSAEVDRALSVRVELTLPSVPKSDAEG